MTFFAFKELLSKIPKKIDICFTGFVEPFSNPEMIQMQDYAAKIGYDIHLYTTFRGANCSHIENLKGIDIKSFVIHLPDSLPMMNLEIDNDYLKTLGFFHTSAGNFSNVSYMCIGHVHPEIKKIIKTDIREAPVYLRAGHVDDDVYLKLLDSSKFSKLKLHQR